MNDINDERIILEKLKIDSNTYKLALSFLVISVLIQQFFLKLPIESYVWELVAILLALAYQGYCHVKKGIGNGEVGKKKEILVSSIMSSLFGVAILLFLGSMSKPIQITKTFLIIFVLNFVVRFIIDFFTRKKQTEIDKILDEED